ncbi:lytic transglycosylase domain-containing protein [Planktotalea sp.]|uniref:lytic transglycosylase domain-containing protein n=1 Tax=Planktotalea sp. TaxID=2029877 RepID=UPI003F6BC185
MNNWLTLVTMFWHFLTSALRCRLVQARMLAGAVFFNIFTAALSASPSDECLRSIRYASHETGVPASLLLAISRVETGRSVGGVVKPWPWAINVRGTGEWLATKEALLEHALAQISKGETRFDVGCFQLNYRWHGDSFASLDEMISPKSNALYAAKFLKSLYLEFGDWTKAAGSYHSRTDELAAIYKAKLAQHYESSQITAPTLTPAQRKVVTERPNFYPLLQPATLKSHLGSLVPRDAK